MGIPYSQNYFERIWERYLVDPVYLVTYWMPVAVQHPASSVTVRNWPWL